MPGLPHPVYRHRHAGKGRPWSASIKTPPPSTGRASRWKPTSIVLAIQTFGTLIHFHPHLHGLITDGAFDPAGRFLPLPVNLSYEPFLRLWEHKVFRLLLNDGKIDPSLVIQMRSWKHSGFHVDRSVHLAAGDRAGIERLAQYMARSPFSLSRLLKITPEGKVLYKADKDHCQPYPRPVSEDLFAGVSRNFQVFEPLDFIAELTQHIPNKGEHLIRYYGCYSNKNRGVAAKQAAATLPTVPPVPPPAESARPPDRRRWAMLIQRIYQTDPLLCPHCGGTMKVISFIEARQGEVVRKILQHCGLWHDPPMRAPPAITPTQAAMPEPDPGITYEVDPDFIEHAHREQTDQMEFPWEP